jgi:hypothetical protein
MLQKFVPFQKIPRISRDIIVTEKIDGTNAVVHVDDHGAVTAGSRSRWLTQLNDNFGFAKWVSDNENELRELGEGYHYGEWWGSGIQRGYGLTKGEKRFSLFNVSRWCDNSPDCCSVVPTLYEGEFRTESIEYALYNLCATGSHAAPGFRNPEGIVIYHTGANFCFKKTFERDGKGKGE